MKIDFDAKSSRFLIQCDMWENDKLRALPNRRWIQGKKHWAVPNVRVNVEHLKKNHGDATWSAAAKAALNVPRTIVRKGDFPDHVYSFKTKPFIKQLEALHHGYRSNVFAFFMDMGTGKSKVSIDTFCAHRIEGHLIAGVIVCPLSLRMNWQREIAIHSPIPIDTYLLDSGKPKEFDRWRATKHDFKVLLVGVESLAAGRAASMVKQFLMTCGKSFMLVDEASKIKSHSATRSKACVELGQLCEYRYILTGTPIANGPMDLFMQFEFLNSDILGVGDFWSFRNRYAVMGGYENKEVVGYQNMAELVETVAPFVFQCRKEEVVDLPPKVYEIRTVELSDEQARVYKGVKKEGIIYTKNGEHEVKNVLENMLRRQEICGGFMPVLDPDGNIVSKEAIGGVNAKLNELLDIAAELVVVNKKAIVWCAYRAEIALIAAALRKQYGHDSVVELHGGIDESQRDINVNVLFQKGAARFCVGNAATGGMGLTMTAAEAEIYYSNTFNFIDRQQSEDRAHRTGQTKSVKIIDIIYRGTVDSTIANALKSKLDVSEYVRRAISAVNTTVDPDGL